MAFDLDTQDLSFRVPIPKNEGTYVRMNLIEQNLAGDTFAIAVQDDGHFFVLVLNNKGEMLDWIDVS